MGGTLIQIVSIIDVEVKDVADALCCAFEGGSTYWCSRVVVKAWPGGGEEWAHEALATGGKLTIYTYDDEDGIDVDMDDVRSGLSIMADQWPRQFSDLISSNSDADTGDLLLQLITFKEVVYG